MKTIGKIATISMLCLLPVAGFANQKAIYEKHDGANVGARVTFQYRDDSMFHVNTKPGFVTDIQLREGEELTYVAGGDTKSWLIDKAKVGSVQHVYIKPLAPDKHTNVIINTDMHTYRFDVWSTNNEYDPLITFRFPDDKLKSKGYNKTFTPPYRNMNRAYDIKAKNAEKYKELIPSTIMDDGERTYIRIPETNRYDMPVLYMVNPWDKKQTLVNYRVRDGYFVADVVMEHGRLFYHQKYKIDFYNKAKAGERGSMRERIAAIVEEENDFETQEPVYRRQDRNPVEDEVYTVPPDVEVRQAKVVKEKPVKPVKEESMFVPAPVEKVERVRQNVVPYDVPAVQQPVKQVAPAPVYREEIAGDYPIAGQIGEEIAQQALKMGPVNAAPAPAPKPAAVSAPAKAPAQAKAPATNTGKQMVAVLLDDGRVVHLTRDGFDNLADNVKQELITKNRVRVVQANR